MKRKRRVLLECDLGEGEPPENTRALMRWIDAANIACGGHAGDAASMERCVSLAKRAGVLVGAHPGPWSRAEMGRGGFDIGEEALELLLLQQVGALEAIARAKGARLHHVKLHGSLYHAADADPALARRYLTTVRRFWPGAAVIARAGGLVHRLARRAGVRALGEAFADRGYRADGTLVPRGEPGALLTDPAAVAARVARLVREGVLEAETGASVPVEASALCVHGDSPGAPALARAAARALRVKNR